MNPHHHLYALFIIALLLLISCQEDARAEALILDRDQQYDYAAQLFQNRHFLESAAEYHRFAHFFADDPRQRQALFNAGSAYLKAGEFPSAITQFDTLTQVQSLDEVATNAFFMLADTYLQAHEPGQAVIALHNLIALTRDEAILDRAYYRLSWIRINLLDWPGAQAAINHISTNGHRVYQIADLSAALDETDTLPRKSPTLAGLLSVLPGAGQLYCGRYEDALIAFVMDVGLFWASYESFDQNLSVLGALLAIVGTGFYTSNIYSAVSSAHKHNDAQQHRFMEQLKQRFSLGFGPSGPIGKSIAGGPALTLQFHF